MRAYTNTSNAEHHPVEHVSNDGRRSTEKHKI
jgi:hypothetical protein